MGLLRRASDRFVYGALRGAMALIGLVPPETAERLARAAGRLYRRIDRARAQTVRENVRVAFGDRLGPVERERIEVGVFEHFFAVAVEVVVRPRLFPDVRAYRRRTDFRGDLAAARADVRAGRNGILLTAHLGNWELASACLQAEGLPISAVARPIDNPHVNRWLTGRRGGAEILIYKKGAVRAVVDAIRRGRWVGVLADQNAGRNGAFVPFFGVPASTFALGAAVAVREDLPVFFGAAIRSAPGFRYEIRMKRYDHSPLPGEDHRSRIDRILRAYSLQLEAWVREFPDQYFWLHRRWRTRPAGETPGPHLPAYPRKRRDRPVAT